jgi:hypothetical protein
VSKRSWLPTSKGTELFPTVIQAPTRLIIEGVRTGTPLYRAVADRLGGRLKQFHGKQQQMYALSERKAHRGHIDWGDGARATYTNVDGRETLRLEVDAGVLETLSKQLAEDWWEWALIDIKIPHTNISTGVVSAIVYAQRKVPAALEDGVLFEGFAYDRGQFVAELSRTIYSDGLDPFVISYGHTGETIGTETLGADITQTASLLVDLRRFPRAPVVLDVYGYLSMGGSSEEAITGYSRSFLATFGTTTSTPTGISLTEFQFDPAKRQELVDIWGFGTTGRAYVYYGLGISLFDSNAPYDANYGALSGFFNPVPIPAPTPVLSAGSSVATDGLTWTHQTDLVLHSPSNLPMQVTEWFMRANIDTDTIAMEQRVVSWTPIVTHTGPIFVPADPEERAADVQGIGGFWFNYADWGAVENVGASDTFYRWDRRDRYPSYVDTVHAGDAELTAEARLIGTVIIDPVHKVITFEPAA